MRIFRQHIVWVLCCGLLAGAGACGDDSGGVTDADVDAGRGCDGADCVDGQVPADAGADADTDTDSGDGSTPWDGVPLDRPLRLAFIGNSFTHQGPVPVLVRDIAAGVGWPEPEVDYNAPGGETLSGHRTLPDTLALVDAGDWDFVVVQEYSTRPTDNIGDPAQFKTDAAWFYDRIKAASPQAQVVLYETWARHPDHSFYPGSFTDPAQMQAQLRLHYNDAADNYIPANALFSPSTDVQVAPVGDAWELHLAAAGALRLHGSDDYHAGENGRYLNALVLYSTIYGVVADGASALGLDPADAALLQAAADQTTGATRIPPEFPRPPFAVGQSVQVDFGTLETVATGWSNVLDCVAGSSADLVDSTGVSTGVDARMVDAFSGANESGLSANTLGYPGNASADVCWTGSFDGHTAALSELGVVELGDLAPGHYELRLFASRTGDDSGAGRLSRYTVNGETIDLEVSDNVGDEAVFADVSPDASGSMRIEVTVSPAGTARFTYLGALVLTKISD